MINAKRLIRSAFLAIIFLLSISSITLAKRVPIDPQATKETKALFNNLWKLSKKHTLFGHQHDTQYGHG